MPDARNHTASRFDQLELCFEAAAGSLPSAAALRCRAQSLLHAIGATDLARRVGVEWNWRMHTSVGRADFNTCLVSLNPALQRFGEAEIDRTLRHELAHLLAHARVGRRRIVPHGPEWQRACVDLGIKGERACHKLPLGARQLRRRFVYRCRHCESDFPRVRRIRRATACLSCCRRFARGNYDERFRLYLVKGRLERNFPPSS